MSTQDMSTAVVAAATRRLSFAHMGGMHLDIGAGRGELIRALDSTIPMRSVACDVHVQPLDVDGVPYDQVNLNHEPLPYSDAQFDLITASGVVEHIENYRHLMREMFRTMKGSGIVVITTPNVLNVKSRVRYLLSGFTNLFDPLPVDPDTRSSARRHITSVPYFYLAHALREAGFDKVELAIDRVQKASVGWLVVLFPFLLAGWLRFKAREQKKSKTITVENAPLVASHFSWPLLVGRTIVVSAMKPGPAHPSI
jgi:SAM-dependent methyltransferase